MKKIEHPHIVESFKLGNTEIEIADNCCVDEEEAKKILERLVDITQPVLSRQILEQQKVGV